MRRTKFVLMFLAVSLSGACATSATFQITPPGQVVAGILGSSQLYVVNNVKDGSVAFVDIVDQCRKIHARLTIGADASISPGSVPCVYPRAGGQFIFTAKGYTVRGSDTVYVGLSTRHFSSGYSESWEINSLR